ETYRKVRTCACGLTLWRVTQTPDPLSNPSEFMRAAGLELDEAGPTRVTGWIDAGPQHHQPFGIVHGGVYASAVETAASVGASLAARSRGLAVVGVNNNTNFVRSVSVGRIDVEALPLQQGRTQQLWEVRLTDDRARLVAIGQVRL